MTVRGGAGPALSLALSLASLVVSGCTRTVSGDDIGVVQDARVPVDAHDTHAFDAYVFDGFDALEHAPDVVDAQSFDAPIPCRHIVDARVDGPCVTTPWRPPLDSILRPWNAPCATNTECATGQCITGRCSATCASGSDCPGSPDWFCSDGSCRCISSIVESCDGRDNDCNGVVDDCARCTRRRVCVSGNCVCPPEQTCGSSCVDHLTNGAHCGVCDHVCVTGTMCQAGLCVPTQVDQIVTDGSNGCALLSDATVRCWGGSHYGELGTGIRTGPAATDADAVVTPEPVLGLADVVHLWASDGHYCAIRGDASVACWGQEYSTGDLEFGVQASDACWQAGGLPNPWAVGCSPWPNESCALRGAEQVIVRRDIHCIVDSSRVAACRVRPFFVRHSWDLRGVIQLEASTNIACALDASGIVACVDILVAGAGATDTMIVADTVPDLADARQIAVQSSFACALRSDARVVCWGTFPLGGDLTDAGTDMLYTGTEPVLIPGLVGVVQLVATTASMCALRDDGRTICWGATPYRRLPSVSVLPPTIMTEMPRADRLWGGSALCARAMDGATWCVHDGDLMRVAF